MILGVSSYLPKAAASGEVGICFLSVEDPEMSSI